MSILKVISISNLHLCISNTYLIIYLTYIWVYRISGLINSGEDDLLESVDKEVDGGVGPLVKLNIESNTIADKRVLAKDSL